MATAELNKKTLLVNDGMDSIVVVKDLGDIPGGAALDCSGVAEGTELIRSGHVIVRDTATGEYSPLGVTDGAYDSLPEGKAYAGVLKGSVLVDNAQAAILTIGQVNAAASPYPVTEDIVAGLPRIQFLYV